MAEELSDQELRRAYRERFGRSPSLVDVQPQPRRLGALDILMYLVCFVLAAVLLWALVLAPLAERVGLVAPVQTQTITAPPTAYPTLPVYQPASIPQAPPQIIYRDAPTALSAAPQATAGAVIVVTPTFATGCHDGVAYINGVPTNGGCAGGLYAPEEATATVEMKAATTYPMRQDYKDAVSAQALHCIRGCKPTPKEGE